MVVNIDKFIDENEAGTLAGGFAVAPISWTPTIVQDISGPPTLSTMPGSQISTLDHADGVTSGLKFEFAVPENYDSGPLQLQVVYAMSTAVASPNNVVVLSVGAEIADATGGGIDVATYAQAPVSVTTPDNSTNVDRSITILSIMEGDFASGDKIIFLVERLGGNGSDVHTGAFKLLEFLVVYDGQVAPNVAMHQVSVYSDAGGTPAVPGTKSSFDTLDFQEGFTHEQKFQWVIPDNWDGVSDFHVRFTYAMTTAGGGDVRFDFSGNAASITTGLVTTLPFATFIIPTFTDTEPHRTTVVYAIPGFGRAAGDVITVVFNRPSGGLFDTHTGNFQLLGTTVSIGQGGSTATTTEIDEIYLPHRDFRIITMAGVNAEQESADFATEFELWAFMSSTVAAGRVDVEWQGRLRATQTKITSIKIPVRGQGGGPTPGYQIKVYVEGSGSTNVYSGSVLTPETTGARSVVTITEGDLTAQPIGEKRYFVVVEAYLDAGEELRVGTPFVKQE